MTYKEHELKKEAQANILGGILALALGTGINAGIGAGIGAGVNSLRNKDVRSGAIRGAGIGGGLTLGGALGGGLGQLMTGTLEGGAFGNLVGLPIGGYLGNRAATNYMAKNQGNKKKASLQKAAEGGPAPASPAKPAGSGVPGMGNAIPPLPPPITTPDIAAMQQAEAEAQEQAAKPPTTQQDTNDKLIALVNKTVDKLGPQEGVPAEEQQLADAGVVPPGMQVTASLKKAAMSPATRVFLTGLLGNTVLGAGIGAAAGAGKGEAGAGAIRGASIGSGITLGGQLGTKGAQWLNRMLLASKNGSNIPLAGYAGIRLGGDIGGAVAGGMVGNAVGKKITKKAAQNKQAGPITAGDILGASAFLAGPALAGGALGAIKDYKKGDKGHNTAKGIGAGLGATLGFTGGGLGGAFIDEVIAPDLANAAQQKLYRAALRNKGIGTAKVINGIAQVPKSIYNGLWAAPLMLYLGAKGGAALGGKLVKSKADKEVK